jgi:hypothetical protein
MKIVRICDDCIFSTLRNDRTWCIVSGLPTLPDATCKHHQFPFFGEVQASLCIVAARIEQIAFPAVKEMPKPLQK